MLPTGRVTFLFTDIEGSTSLFQKDHAAMDAALVQHHEIMTNAIERHSGRVFQIIGDAFCAAFEQPADAVAAALRAQDALRARVMPVIGQIRVRMGIHTGDIAMRDGTYASSLTLVKVQRVMSAGHGGQILLSEDAAAPVRDDLCDGIALKDMGAHRLRGLAAPLEIFQLIGPSLPAEFPPLKTVNVDPTNPATLLELLQSGVLVGRERELGELREHLSLAMGSRGHLVLMSGEPGVGKTRLAEAIMDEARLTGAVTMRGGSYEYEATTPYLPFVEAIRQWIHHQSPERLRDAMGTTAVEIARFAPELIDKLGDLAPNPSLPPNEERLRLFDNVARFLERLSQENGLVFFIDDLHWADESTLALLHYLVRHLKSSRVLIVGAYREVELDRQHPLSAALVEWNRERLTTRIPLARLTAADTSVLLSTLLGMDAITDELNELLFRETEGNPFFVQESVKTLIEQGSIYREDDEWRRSEISELAVPQSVREAVGRRLNRLSEETTKILHVAAALGKQFAYDELAAAVDVTEDDLLDGLDESVAAQLLSSTPHDGFAFTHDKIREVLYQELNPIRRRRLHQKIGESLVALLDGGSNFDPQEVAYHFAQSGDLERVLHYSRLAADAAATINAFDEAQRYLSQALEAAESLSSVDEQVAVLEHSGELFSEQGRSRDAAERYEAAIALGSGPREGYLQIKLGGALAMASDPRGIAIVEAGLEAIPADVDPVWHAMGLTALGRFYHYQARPHEAIEVLVRACEIARPTDDEMVLTSAFAFLAGAYEHLGDTDESEKSARELIALGERRGSPHAMALGNEYLAENAFISGRPAEAVGYSRRGLELGEQIGSQERIAWAAFTMSQALHVGGDLVEARDAIERAIDLALSIGDDRLVLWGTSGLSGIESDMGHYERAAELADEGLQRSESLDQIVLTQWAHYAAGYVRLRRGDVEESIPYFEKCVELSHGSEVFVMNRLFISCAFEAYLRAGKTERAREILDLTERSSPSTAANRSLETERRALEFVFAGPGESNESGIEALNEWIATADSAGWKLQHARALFVRAHVYERIGRPADASADRETSDEILAAIQGVVGMEVRTVPSTPSQ
jgi:class 3 adenylate cyclase/tetratricopeptide (TPR) repeat protein